MQTHGMHKQVLRELLIPRHWRPPESRDFFLDADAIHTLCDQAEAIFQAEPTLLRLRGRCGDFGRLERGKGEGGAPGQRDLPWGSGVCGIGSARGCMLVTGLVDSSRSRQACPPAHTTTLSQIPPKLPEPTAPVKIFGDLHGQFGDLMRLFEEYGTPSTSGDITYIDYLVGVGFLGGNSLAGELRQGGVGVQPVR